MKIVLSLTLPVLESAEEYYKYQTRMFYHILTTDALYYLPKNPVALLYAITYLPSDTMVSVEYQDFLFGNHIDKYITLIPLREDIKVLKTFLIDKSHLAGNEFVTYTPLTDFLSLKQRWRHLTERGVKERKLFSTNDEEWLKDTTTLARVGASIFESTIAPSHIFTNMPIMVFLASVLGILPVIYDPDLDTVWQAKEIKIPVSSDYEEVRNFFEDAEVKYR